MVNSEYGQGRVSTGDHNVLTLVVPYVFLVCFLIVSSLTAIAVRT